MRLQAVNAGELRELDYGEVSVPACQAPGNEFPTESQRKRGILLDIIFRRREDDFSVEVFSNSHSARIAAKSRKRFLPRSCHLFSDRSRPVSRGTAAFPEMFTESSQLAYRGMAQPNVARALAAAIGTVGHLAGG